MNWTLPGTVLQIDSGQAAGTAGLFRSMFLPGGMVLSQVAGISGLEPYTVQNWVKRGFLAPPKGKRYTMRQLCRILNINMLKGALPMERICRLIGSINGRLDDESDDLIDESQLYFLFVRLAARAWELDTEEKRQEAVSNVLMGYEEPVPGARERIAQVLRVMLTAYLCTCLRQETERQLEQLMRAQPDHENRSIN